MTTPETLLEATSFTPLCQGMRKIDWMGQSSALCYGTTRALHTTVTGELPRWQTPVWFENSQIQ